MTVRPTAVLRDRVSTAVDLYFDGKVQKLLMTGDNRFLDYNEPGGMYEYAIELGVPEEDIVLDYGGRRTYDSCYRASPQSSALPTPSSSPSAITCRGHFSSAASLISNLVALSLKNCPTPAAPNGDLESPGNCCYPCLPARRMDKTPPPPVLGDPEPIFTEN